MRTVGLVEEDKMVMADAEKDHPQWMPVKRQKSGHSPAQPVKLFLASLPRCWLQPTAATCWLASYRLVRAIVCGLHFYAITFSWPACRATCRMQSTGHWKLLLLQAIHRSGQIAFFLCKEDGLPVT